MTNEQIMMLRAKLAVTLKELYFYKRNGTSSSKEKSHLAIVH